MLNKKTLRRALKLGNAKEVAEILRGAPKEHIRLTKGWTPLHVAVRFGKQDVIQAVLDAGGNVNATTDMLQTPLDVALTCAPQPIVKLLRSKGALSGSELALHPAAAAGNLKAVRKHLRAGADINSLCNGQLPICLALHHGHWDVAKCLLKKKCDVTARQAGGETPLHVAAAVAAPEPLLETLLKLGARVNDADFYSRSPLCCAAEKGHSSTAEWLLSHGADVTTGKEHASTPVYWALREKHTELASHLIDLGAKATLHQAIECNHLARAHQLLTSGVDPNHEEDPERDDTPLELALWFDCSEMAELLLKSGANANQQDESHTSQDGQHYGGDTPLHVAVYRGSSKMVKILLAHGANPDTTNAQGYTPIELAKRRNCSHLASLMEAHIDKTLSLSAAQNGVEPLYTVQKVADILSVDDTFVLELIKTRKITGLHLDEKTLRIPAGTLQRYLAKLAKQEP